MPPETPPRSLLLIIGLYSLTAGCSLALEWDTDRLPCAKDQAQACLDGYSCLAELCIADHSLGEGEPCGQTRQCSQELTCPVGDAACRRSCTTYFDSGADCAAGQACFPIFDAPAELEAQAACLPSSCASDSDCDQGGVCVLVDEAIGHCYTACSYAIEGGSYQDDSEQGTCHPAGPADHQRMVLWEAGQRNAGVPCNVVEEPCAEGLVCLTTPEGDEVCHALCDSQAAAENGCHGKTCVDGDAQGLPFDYCMLTE